MGTDGTRPGTAKYAQYAKRERRARSGSPYLGKFPFAYSAYFAVKTFHPNPIRIFVNLCHLSLNEIVAPKRGRRPAGGMKTFAGYAV